MIQKLKLLGPGLIYAGAAVGVSHLVQSTRAGANYGFDLLLIVILANVFKYPYFESSARYCAATGENLLQGYKKIGSGAVILALLVTISTMLVIQSAVTVVTAGLIGNLLGVTSATKLISYAILILAALVLALGHYKALDRVIKFIVVILAVTTLITFIGAFANP
jgi:Mn2+/Fe2+ NRAMP family transporter